MWRALCSSTPMQFNAVLLSLTLLFPQSLLGVVDSCRGAESISELTVHHSEYRIDGWPRSQAAYNYAASQSLRRLSLEFFERIADSRKPRTDNSDHFSSVAGNDGGTGESLYGRSLEVNNIHLYGMV